MADRAPIDPASIESILQMVGGDSAFLAELIDTYLADSPQLLAELRQAVAGDDAGQLCRAAHSLRSNSEGFGAWALAGLARRLEELGRAGGTAGAAALLAEAGAEYERVQAALLAARHASLQGLR